LVCPKAAPARREAVRGLGSRVRDLVVDDVLDQPDGARLGRVDGAGW